MGLYGLPPSKLPKTAPESGVGKDLPDDKRFKRPDPITAATTSTRRPTIPVKIDLKSLNKTKPGRVEKTKSITISGLTEALKLVKNQFRKRSRIIWTPEQDPRPRRGQASGFCQRH
jgi:hypothetical protein